jgi:hypothetical protein
MIGSKWSDKKVFIIIQSIKPVILKSVVNVRPPGGGGGCEVVPFWVENNLIPTRTIDPFYTARGHLTPPSEDGFTNKTLSKDRIIITCQHITIQVQN